MVRSTRQSTLDTYSGTDRIVEVDDRGLEWVAIGASNGREVKIRGEPGNFVCPKCGQGGIATKDGVRTHYKLKPDHEGTISEVRYECDHCGATDGDTNRSMYRPDGTNFCSTDCHNTYQLRYSKSELIEQLQRHDNSDEDFKWATVAADPDCATLNTFETRFGSIAAAKVEAGIADHPQCPTCGRVCQRLSRHWFETECSSPPLTQYQREIITGLVMGDATATRNGTATRITIATVTENFLEWVSDQLGIFSSGVRPGATAEYSLQRARKHESQLISDDPEYQDQYVLQTITSEVFDPWSEWYGDNGKRFPDDLTLTPTIAAMWYVCDGGLYSTDKTPVPVITAANEADRPGFLRSLFEDVGFDVSVNRDAIRVPAAQAHDFLDWIDDAPPDFAYKYARTRSEYRSLKP